MTVHRAEQIIEAVRDLIAARVEPLGVKCFVHRRLSLDPEQDELPGITVDYGEDRKAEQSILGAITSLLTVECTAVALAATEPELRESLLELRAQIHRAVMADPRLGLHSFVSSTFYGGANAPGVDVSGEKLVGELTSSWLVLYEMSLSDPAN